MRKRIETVFIGLLVTYTVILFLLPVFWWAWGERHWPLILLRYMPSVLLLLPLSILLLPIRKRSVWVGGMVLAAIVVFFYMGFEFPGRASKEGSLSVMSYNIRAGLAGPEKIGPYLVERKVDIVGLQEARAPLADPTADPVPALSEALHGYHMSRGGSRGELVTYSRYPILVSSEVDMGGIARVLDTRVSVDGRPLRILNLHLMTGDPTGKLKTDSRNRFRFLNVTAESRRVQFEALSEIVAQEEVPTLLLGDFNTPPNSVGHALLSRSLTDSFGAVGAGFGYTYRADLPVWRIDYIWSRGLIPQASWVEPSPLSDHRAVLSRFEWERGLE